MELKSNDAVFLIEVAVELEVDVAVLLGYCFADFVTLLLVLYILAFTMTLSLIVVHSHSSCCLAKVIYSHFKVSYICTSSAFL